MKKNLSKVLDETPLQFAVFLKRGDELDWEKKIEVLELSETYNIASDGIPHPSVSGLAILALKAVEGAPKYGPKQPGNNSTWVNKVFDITDKCIQTFYNDNTLMNVKNVSSCNTGPGNLTVWTHSSIIEPMMVGHIFAVYDGRRHIFVLVTDNMLGYRLGKFAPFPRLRTVLDVILVMLLKAVKMMATLSNIKIMKRLREQHHKLDYIHSYHRLWGRRIPGIYILCMLWYIF